MRAIRQRNGDFSTVRDGSFLCPLEPAKAISKEDLFGCEMVSCDQTGSRSLALRFGVTTKSHLELLSSPCPCDANTRKKTTMRDVIATILALLGTLPGALLAILKKAREFCYTSRIYRRYVHWCCARSLHRAHTGYILRRYDIRCVQMVLAKQGADLIGAEESLRYSRASMNEQSFAAASEALAEARKARHKLVEKVDGWARENERRYKVDVAHIEATLSVRLFVGNATLYRA